MMRLILSLMRIAVHPLAHVTGNFLTCHGRDVNPSTQVRDILMADRTTIDLTLPMLKLLSSKAQGCKDLWKQSKPCWYSLDSSHWVLSEEYQYARVSVIFQLFRIIFFLQNRTTIDSTLPKLRLLSSKAYWYTSESTQRELSNEYQHDRV